MFSIFDREEGNEEVTLNPINVFLCCDSLWWLWASGSNWAWAA